MEVGATDLVHAAGHGTDQCLVTEVLMKALQVDLPVNAIVWRSLRWTTTKSEGKGEQENRGKWGRKLRKRRHKTEGWEPEK